jgi:predicted TIM-barrel fold metal-dependent hydrolase
MAGVSVDAPPGTAVIDCDVHSPTPTVDMLRPYLSRHWIEYFNVTTTTAMKWVAATYPRWSPFTGPPATLEDVQRDVLGRADVAVVQCFSGVESVLNPYMAAELASAVNRWLQAEWLDREKRLRAFAVVTPHFTEAAVAEIERIAADDRFVGILVPARSTEPYGNHRYWPIWAAAAEHGLPVAVTLGGATPAPPTAVHWMSSWFEEYAVAAHPFHVQVTTLVLSGVLHHCPELRIAVLESGWTWLPSLLWRLEQEWKAGRAEIPWVKEPPAEYVRRHCRFSTQPIDLPGDPQRLAEILEHLDSDELLIFGSDYPHRYAESFDDLGLLLDERQRGLVLGGNARAFFRLSG